MNTAPLFTTWESITLNNTIQECLHPLGNFQMLMTRVHSPTKGLYQTTLYNYTFFSTFSFLAQQCRLL